MREFMRLVSEPEKVRDARKHASGLLVGPWYPLGRLTGATKTRALRKQLSIGHKMFGQWWYAIGAKEKDDDVMFANKLGGIAIVRLTYSKKTNPQFPYASLYASVDEAATSIATEAAYVEALVRAGPSTHCTHCGVDWTTETATPDCPVCEGYGLTRPCPICGGPCGAVWARAVIDSNDFGHPVWIGACHSNRD